MNIQNFIDFLKKEFFVTLTTTERGNRVYAESKMIVRGWSAYEVMSLSLAECIIREEKEGGKRNWSVHEIKRV